MIMLSPHFLLEELIRSDVATRKGIYNYPSADVLENLKVLAQGLEAVRTILGRPVLVSSGYRSEELNSAIGGSKTSAHMSGLAADFTCPAFGSPREVFDQLRQFKDLLGYDQLIKEGDAWVHVGFSHAGKTPRGEDLIARFSPLGVEYERA